MEAQQGKKKKMEAEQEGEAGRDCGGGTWKERRGSGIIINIQFVQTLNLSNFGVYFVHFALMLLVCGL